MRILHVIHSFPPESRGGTETYVEDLARAQHARGNAVVVLAGSERRDRVEPAAREDHEGLEVWRLRAPARGIESLVGVDEPARAALESVLARVRPEVVHLHHWHNLTSDAAATARRAGCAVVASLHDLWITCPLFFRLPDARDVCPPSLPQEECVRCISRFVAEPAAMLAARFDRRRAVVAAELAAVSAVLTLSESQRAFLAALDELRDVAFETVPLPAPAMPVVAPRAAQRVEPGRLHVASWGGLDPGKGLLTLVEAAAQLARPERFTIRHLGRVLDAGYRDAVVAAAKGVELELAGPFEPAGLAAASARCDVAVFPSLYLETHGFVVDEALALGLPVLVSDRGAPKERIGSRGRVFPAADRVALGRLLEACCEGTLIEELRRGTAPPTVAMERHLGELEVVYRRALGSLTRTGSADPGRSRPRPPG